MFKHKKKEESPSPRPGQQSSAANWGDDEYAQLIEGVKKVYRNKIKPLEVTYNFEGMFVLITRKKASLNQNHSTINFLYRRISLCPFDRF